MTNVFVYNFKGELIHDAVNCQDRWNNTKMENMSLYLNLRADIIISGFAILGYYTFINLLIMVTQLIMPSERKSAEWGLCALKEPLDILGLPLDACAKKIYKIICNCCRLLNLWTRRIGLNPIWTMYDAGTDVQS